MNKVLQAAGRVIRTPEDRGAVLLLDDRFAQQEYIRLFLLTGGISAICAAAKNWPLPCRTSGINETQTKGTAAPKTGAAVPLLLLFYFAAFRFCCRLSHEGISLRSFSHMGMAVPACLRKASKASSRYCISFTACMAWSETHRRPSRSWPWQAPWRPSCGGLPCRACSSPYSLRRLPGCREP